MGLFSKKGDGEPTHSRQWISRYGPKTRKTELAIASLNRIASLDASSVACWGQPLDETQLEPAREVLSRTLIQDHSLSRHVTRDLTLAFESLGGLLAHQAAALESVGAPTGDISRSGAATLAVARTIKARFEGAAPSPSDEALYLSHFEDSSSAAHDRALSIGAWSATVTARLHNRGTLNDNGSVFFEPGQDRVGEMWAAGFYPNPVNAGDTSNGDASIERFWDGTDWTSRARVRDGRRWAEQEVSLFTAPSN